MKEQLMKALQLLIYLQELFLLQMLVKFSNIL